MQKHNMATLSKGARKAEVRQAEDGFSVFTWSDFGGTVGIVQWREEHSLEWSQAYKAATDWVNAEAAQ